jgi:ketosteroid isomerase-like protein
MITALLHLLVLFTTPGQAAVGFDQPPPALAAMAETERAFSARATETNWRDAFIEYFADESVSFQPGPGPARERLRKAPLPKPDERPFTWEPRTGDVAASGDLGYLTGPVRYPQPDGSIRHGCYFSVWKKQEDGRFKVILDLGTQPRAEAPFAPGFVRAAATGVRSNDSKADAQRTLLDTDRAFSGAIGDKGAAEAYRAFMHEGARLHRNGIIPLATRASASAWMASNVKAMTSEPMKSETAASGDLGYTWGKVTETGAAGETRQGYYVRVWTRRADGTWQMAIDVAPLEAR